jgi:hypothetical protein
MTGNVTLSPRFRLIQVPHGKDIGEFHLQSGDVYHCNINPNSQRFGGVVIEEQTRMHSGANLYPPDTCLDMLKRVLAVAELVAKSERLPEDKKESPSEFCEKHNP